jgi:hypothetical protein
MQPTNSSPSPSVHSPTRDHERCASSVGSLLELLTEWAPQPHQSVFHSSSPSHIVKFLGESDGHQIASTARELGVAIKNGDWFPFEIALIKRLDPLRHEISKTILTTLSSVSPDSAQSSIFHGGFQIHLDTMCCFWLGHPETASNLEQLLEKIIASAPPFQEEKLNTIATTTMLHCIATGTLALPHFTYHHLSPEFVTMSCHPSVQQEASRYLLSQERKRRTR